MKIDIFQVHCFNWYIPISRWDLLNHSPILFIICSIHFLNSFKKSVQKFSKNISSGWVFLGLLTNGRGQKYPPLPPLLKICHTYSAMMKLGAVIYYLKNSKNYMKHVAHPLSFVDISQFSPEISKFCYVKKYIHRLHFDTKLLILLTFLESLRIFLIRKVTILMMSLKITTPDLLKIKYVHNVTNKNVSRDSNYIVDVVG